MAYTALERPRKRATSVDTCKYILVLLLFTVSGEANFSMASTNLTVGGFTQPGVARALIDVPANTEKGLSQRFLWLFPAPLYEHIESLTEVNRDFLQKMSE